MKIKFKDRTKNQYTIKFKKPQVKDEDKDLNGYYYYPKNGRGEIQIDPDMSNQLILNTVVHEMAHAFFEDATETDTNNFANAVSRVLYNKLKFRSSDLQSIVK